MFPFRREKDKLLLYVVKEDLAMAHYTIDPLIQAKIPGMKLGILHYDDVRLSETPGMLKGRINLFMENMRYDYLDKAASDVPGIKEWRDAFKAAGMDPSRYRPSSEALVRRVLQNKPFHWVNTGVDLNNFISLQFALPAGLYNRDKLEGDIAFRFGKPGETYDGLNGRELSCEGKLILADDKGPFGSPFVDSVRSSVEEDAANLLHVFFIHPGFTRWTEEQLLSSAAEMFTHVNGGVSRIKDDPYLVIS
jgi:DNA/RNA-binding domain of Phe-tRNA-synthetase-like protein